VVGNSPGRLQFNYKSKTPRAYARRRGFFTIGISRDVRMRAYARGCFDFFPQNNLIATTFHNSNPIPTQNPSKNPKISQKTTLNTPFHHTLDVQIPVR